MEYALLLQAVFLPLLLSPVAYIIGRKLGPNVATWFTFGVLTLLYNFDNASGFARNL